MVGICKISHMEGCDYWKFSKDHNYKDDFLGKCVLFCSASLAVSYYGRYKTTRPIKQHIFYELLIIQLKVLM